MMCTSMPPTLPSECAAVSQRVSCFLIFDVLYIMNDTHVGKVLPLIFSPCRKLRKSLTTNDLKRAARRPWKKIQDDTAVVAAAAAVAMAVVPPTVASPQFVE